jgi:hypothetical protein
LKLPFDILGSKICFQTQLGTATARLFFNIVVTMYPSLIALFAVFPPSHMLGAAYLVVGAACNRLNPVDPQRLKAPHGFNP